MLVKLIGIFYEEDVKAFSYKFWTIDMAPLKIALCLSGYFDSLKDSSSFGDDGFLYIKKHILDERKNGHEIDVFFHNWQPNLQDKLIQLYNPKKYIIEHQIDFNKIADTHGISKKHLDPLNKLGTGTINSKRGRGYIGPERILSQHYSIQKSFELKKQYEEENNFKYDCVIKSRFDLGRINRKNTGPSKRNKYACQCINFNPTLNMNYLYQVYGNLFNEGPADMWFYSSSENMDNFCYIYDKTLNKYLQPGSDYQKAVINGGPQSKLGDFRSNELFKPKEEQSKLLHKYEPHLVVNAILLCKGFLMDCGLGQSAIALPTVWE